MPSGNQTVMCRYHYDPLDRLASCSSAASDSIQRFYQKSLLATEIQGQIQRSLLLSKNQLLAQQTRRADLTECTLLGTDQQRSVLNTSEHLQVAYTPYGTRQPLLDLPGFNGEQPDPVTGHYLLGNGYRAFNPVLMRFNSPDSLSPFGGGGINAYAYCAGDPVNRVDPTGHMFFTGQNRMPSWLVRMSARHRQVEVRVGALTVGEHQAVRDMERFINKRLLDRTLASRAAFAMTDDEFRNSRAVVPKSVEKQIMDARTERLAEENYDKFVREYRSADSDQKKLAQIAREVRNDFLDANGVEPAQRVPYPHDFSARLDEIRKNHQVPYKSVRFRTDDL